MNEKLYAARFLWRAIFMGRIFTCLFFSQVAGKDSKTRQSHLRMRIKIIHFEAFYAASRGNLAGSPQFGGFGIMLAI